QRVVAEVQHHEHAHGDVRGLVCASLTKIPLKRFLAAIVLLALEFEHEAKAVEREHEIDAPTTDVLSFDDQVVQPRGHEPVSQVVLEILLGGAGREQILRAASGWALLCVEASMEE